MSDAGPDPRIERWVRRALAMAPLKAKSLVVTVWGESPTATAMALVKFLEGDPIKL